MISNPHSPKIPSHLCLMLICIPHRFQTSVTAGHNLVTFSLLSERSDISPLLFCHSFSDKEYEKSE